VGTNCASEKLGSVSAHAFNIYSAFTEQATSGAKYDADDVNRFLPVWHQWSAYFVERAYEDHAALLTHLPQIQRAAKELLCNEDISLLTTCLTTLDASARGFVTKLHATLRAASWFDRPTDRTREAVYVNRRHILFNVLSHPWGGDCAVTL
jgi:hypothetical protein